MSIPGRGEGLVALKELRPKVLLGEYLGRRLSAKAEVTGIYQFAVSDDGGHKVMHVVDAKNPRHGSIFRYVNAPPLGMEGNCRFVCVTGRVFLVTLQQISAGEELLAEYGFQNKDFV